MHTVIDIPIYHGKLILLFTDKHSDITDISDQLLAPVEDNQLLCYTYRDFIYEQKTAVMIVFNFWNTLERIRLDHIVHEIEHAGNAICNEANIKIASGIDEPSAYLKGWIASQIQDFLIKNNLQNELFKED